jgi:small conductance mechanosensitive channel
LNDIVKWLSEADPRLMVVVRILLIALVAWIAVAMLGRLVRLFRERVAARMQDSEALKRANTLSRVFRYLVTVIVSLIAGMLVLAELGISVAPILGAAGVVGIAVGFGAQSLVKDYFTGFFILLENQIRQGDVVEIAGKSGIVEELTLRFVRLRDYEGNVHYIPNGLITAVTNRSRGYANAVIDVSISYQASIDDALAAMRAVGAELRADPVFGAKILEGLEIAGVDRWVDTSLTLRGRFKVTPNEQWNVKREYLRRLKSAFAEGGIALPQPTVMLASPLPADAAPPAAGGPPPDRPA